MRLRALDHVALWVSDRDAIADVATSRLGMHVIERTDRFTLVGADARRGKLTLFTAEGPRETGALVHVALRVNEVTGEQSFDAGEGLRIEVVEAPTEVDYDLDHVALRTVDPESAAAAYEQLGFRRMGARRLAAGSAFVELHKGDPGATERPLLNHLGLLVGHGEAAAAENLGVEVVDVVDGPNTFAVFVQGPGGVKLEYVEHKPSFSLE